MLSRKNKYIIRTIAELNVLVKVVEDCKHPIAYDIESSGLDSIKDTMIGFSVASKDFAAYVVMKSWECSTLIEKISYKDITPVLSALKNKRLVTWNASFDCRFTRRQTNIDLTDSVYADALIMCHTLDENRMSYGLKQVAKEVFGESAVGEQADLFESIKSNGGDKSEYYKADSSILAAYGLKDAALTYDLFDYLEPQLSPSLSALYYEELMPLYTQVIIPMEYKGIPVDVEAMSAALTEITQDITALEESIQSAIAPLLTGFNDWYISAKYPFKLTGRFKEVLGRKYAPLEWPKTDKGVVSLSKVEIEKAKKKHGLADNTYFEQVINQTIRIEPGIIQEIQLELMREDGIKYPFNLLSTDHLKRLFFGSTTTKSALKETPLSRTGKGAPQINDEFLTTMARKYPWAADLQVYKGLNKIKGTYIERFLNEQVDGVFYPSYHMHRTVSGRLSGDLQQLPRPISDEAVNAGNASALEQKHTNKLRHFFKARPGYIFIDDDYESLEPHVFAHVSGDQALIDIFNKGHDFYSTIAIAAEGLSQYSADKKAENYLGKLNKDARQKAKAYALGIPYFLSPYALSKNLNCSESEAKRIYNGYLSGFPELKKWMERTETLIWNQGYIETEFGRRRRYPEALEIYHKFGRVLFDPLELWQRYNEQPSTYEWAKSQAGIAKNARNNSTNVQIQGLSAHIVNRACINIARELKDKKLDAHITMQVHDEIVLYASEECKEEAAKIMQYWMENSVKLKLKLKAVPSFGQTYADAKG